MTNRPAPWPTVLWDFDGTLADTVPSIMSATQLATERVLGLRLEDAAIRRLVGEPAHIRIAALVPERADDVYAVYLDLISAVSPETTPLFPGMASIVSRLSEAGVVNALVTSRPRSHVARVLDHWDMGGSFAAFVALEDTVRHKPTGDPLLYALAELGAPAERSVYVGDAVVDLEASRDARVDSVAVTWGAGREADLAAEHPTVLVTTPGELAVALGIENEVAA